MTVYLRFIVILSFCATLLSLTSCGSTPIKPDTDESAHLTLENVQAYLDEREGLSPEQIMARKIKAADFLTHKNQIDRAHTLTDSVDGNLTPAESKIHFLVVQAKIALAEGEPYIAKRYLFNQGAEQYTAAAPKDIAIQFFDLRAQLMFDQSEFSESVSERLKLSPYLGNDELAIQLNHDLIWEALAEIPTDTLYRLAKTERSPIKEGWYSLAALSKSNGANFRQQIVDIEKWQAIWPDHPANSILPADLQLILQLADQQALNIAVFLPLSGKLEGVGNAIREGIMAGYYDDLSHHGITPSIQFYDTVGQDINALYDEALTHGFELVIGPLNKENVAILSKREALPIPVLALNSPAKNETPSQSSTPPLPMAKPADEHNAIADTNNQNTSIYYFSLAVESEAKQVAQRAWRDGHRRALIIAPSSSWGDRGSDAFKQAWLDLGGEIADEKRYKDQRTYSSLIESSVAVDKSKKRKRELRRLIGANLEFEPRRRKDIDFIFLLAYPKQAKQFLPLLAFHYAGDIPVYATSQVYTEEKNVNLADLNGLRFSAMPWHFDQNINERRAIQAYGDNRAPYQALYAMGVDAYHIYPRLEQLKLIRQAQFYGATGKLRVVENNVIERTQNWAEIKRGIAVELKSGPEQASDI